MKKYIDYDYEEAFNKNVEDLQEEGIRASLERGREYVLKEIRSGSQLEIEIYPEFTRKDLPESFVRKKNPEAVRAMHDKNRRKHLERLINMNFSDGDYWCTFTYDKDHLPGSFEEAQKEMKRFLRRVNYRRKKKGLPSAKYICVTEHDPDAKIRWHHHMVMDSMMDRDTVESCWKAGGRNQIRRMVRDEEGFAGMANYITKIKKKKPDYKKSWTSSRGLKQPAVKKTHHKKPTRSGSYRPIRRYVRDAMQNHDRIREIAEAWYPEMTFTRSEIRINPHNSGVYIYARMRRTE